MRKLSGKEFQEIVLGRRLLETAQLHRKTHQLALSGDSAAKEKLAGIAANIEALIEDMHRIEDMRALAPSAGFTDMLHSWAELKNSKDALGSGTH